jgi:membrane protein DedA with SNARE-associated domain
MQRRAATRPKTARRLDWAGDQIKTRGGPLLITARFVPGGRSALTLTSGVTKQPRPWFMGWILVAAIIWGVYAALLGYVGGETFEDNHTAAFVMAFALALSVTVTIEVVRHVRNRRLEKRLAARLPAPDVEPVEP